MENTTLFVLIVKRILRELEVLTETVRIGLSGIQNKIDAIPEDQKPKEENQCGDVRVSPTRIAVESLPPVPDDESTYKNANRSRKRISFHIGWLTLLFVAAYTVITGLQYRITRASLSDNRRSLELLERQVRASVGASIQRQFRVDWPSNRAYVFVVLMNRGKTIATHVEAKFIVEKGTFRGEHFVGSMVKSWDFSVSEIYPDPEMPPTRGIDLELPKASMNSRNGIGTVVRVTGDISYFNGFEVQHREVCQYITGEIEFTNKAGEKQAGSGGGAVECDQIQMRLTDIKTNTDQYYK